MCNSKSFQLHSIAQWQEISNCTILWNSKFFFNLSYLSLSRIVSKKYLIAKYCAIARFFFNWSYLSLSRINLNLCYIQYTMYIHFLLPTDKLKQSLPFSDNKQFFYILIFYDVFKWVVIVANSIRNFNWD